jgi:hypothetical protein
MVSQNKKPSLCRAGFTIEDTLVNHKSDIRPGDTPCLHHPGDWFDPKRRTFTRQQCLNCPILRDCGQSARHHRPSHGMWAGIWIDGDFTDKQHLLPQTTHAPSTGPKHSHRQAITAPATTIGSPPHPGRRSRVGTLVIAAPTPAIAAQITARASGNCEIMAPACTYQQGALFSRRRGAAPRPLSSPADAIAACPNCIELIEHTDTPTALDLGYIVDPRSCTSTTAMLWRQHRWVFLDTHGRIHHTGHPSITHHAS